MVNFLNKKPYKIVLLLVCLALVINLPGLSKTFPSIILRSAFSVVLYPFQYVFSNSLYFVGGSMGNIVYLRDAQRENEFLKKELGFAKLKLENLAQIDKDNSVIAELSKYQKAYSYLNAHIAPIVGRDPSNWFNTVIIGAGSSAGIKVGFPAITYDGIVGYVIEVNPFSSKVILATDSNFSVSAADKNSGDLGLVAGSSPEHLIMKFISRSANISVGDQIITSSVSQTFPKGLPIGTVTKVDKKDYDLFQHIEIKPSVNLGRIQWVLILK